MQIHVAKTFLERLRGMQAAIDAGNTVLAIPYCRSVHTFFMRIPLDIYFLDEEMKVVKKLTDVMPGSIHWCHRARHVMEIASGMEPSLKMKLENALLKKSLTISHKEMYI